MEGVESIMEAIFWNDSFLSSTVSKGIEDLIIFHIHIATVIYFRNI